MSAAIGFEEDIDLEGHEEDTEAGEEQALLAAQRRSEEEADALATDGWSWERAAKIFGPGLVVCLADTDAGCIVTAAQTGVEFGYSFVKIQILLIAPLFMAQDLTVRLGIHTGKGHGELIAQHLGQQWAWFSVGTLFLACCGAMVTQMVGIAAVGQMFGIDAWVSMVVADAALVATVVFSGYTVAERIALGMGLFEFAFFILMVDGLVQGTDKDGFWAVEAESPDYWWMLSANVGAVIMPFMIFYQQSSVVDKGLTKKDLGYARWDTGIGCIVTQAIMTAVIIAGAVSSTDHLDSISAISSSFSSSFGEFGGKIVFGLGILGGSMVAAIVVALAAAWGVGEVAGYPKSLNLSLQQAPLFYLVYFVSMLIGNVVACVCSDEALVTLSIGVEVLNALLLLPVLGFLYLLARKAIPEEHKLQGREAAVYGITFAVIVVICWGSTIYSIATGKSMG